MTDEKKTTETETEGNPIKLGGKPLPTESGKTADREAIKADLDEKVAEKSGKGKRGPGRPKGSTTSKKSTSSKAKPDTAEKVKALPWAGAWQALFGILAVRLGPVWKLSDDEATELDGVTAPVVDAYFKLDPKQYPLIPFIAVFLMIVVPRANKTDWRNKLPKGDFFRPDTRKATAEKKADDNGKAE